MTVLRVIENETVVARVCNSCNEMKNFSEFHKDVNGYMQKKSRCKQCCNKKQRQVDYPKNKRCGLKNRPDVVKRLYGVSYEHVERTFENQHGLCANRGCGKKIYLDGPRGGNKAVIDHNHTTGEFRAILCIPCNLTLGRIEESKNVVLGLLEYLDKFN